MAHLGDSTQMSFYWDLQGSIGVRGKNGEPNGQEHREILIESGLLGLRPKVPLEVCLACTP